MADLLCLFVRDTSALALYPRPAPKPCCELAVVDAGANYTRTCRRTLFFWAIDDLLKQCVSLLARTAPPCSNLFVRFPSLVRQSKHVRLLASWWPTIGPTSLPQSLRQISKAGAPQQPRHLRTCRATAYAELLGQPRPTKQARLVADACWCRAPSCLAASTSSGFQDGLWDQAGFSRC